MKETLFYIEYIPLYAYNVLEDVSKCPTVKVFIAVT
jgi:hypothetical protein